MIKQEGVPGIEDRRVLQTSTETYHLNETQRFITYLSLHSYRRAGLVLVEELLVGTSIYQMQRYRLIVIRDSLCI